MLGMLWPRIMTKVLHDTHAHRFEISGLPATSSFKTQPARPSWACGGGSVGDQSPTEPTRLRRLLLQLQFGKCLDAGICSASLYDAGLALRIGTSSTLRMAMRSLTTYGVRLHRE